MQQTSYESRKKQFPVFPVKHKTSSFIVYILNAARKETTLTDFYLHVSYHIRVWISGSEIVVRESIRVREMI